MDPSQIPKCMMSDDAAKKQSGAVGSSGAGGTGAGTGTGAAAAAAAAPAAAAAAAASSSKPQPQAPSMAQELAMLNQSEQEKQRQLATVKEVLACVWKCTQCGRDCQVCRSENRCICGHRYKEHAPATSDAGKGAKCSKSGCACKNFFYIVAEGAWILRCRCKHKHTEHDPNTKKCLKPGCKLCPTPGGFDSPWVCNCDCPWGKHELKWEWRKLKALPQFDDFGDPALVKRGLVGGDDDGDFA